MMSFDEFKDFVKDHIKDILPDRYDTAEVAISENIKNNDQKVTYVSIRQEGQDIAPSIILEPFYAEYANEGDLDSVMSQIAKIQTDHENAIKVDKEIFTDWDKAKDHLLCRLINREHNEEYLADKPFTPMEDLAVIYAIKVESNDREMASVVITDHMMEIYGVSLEQMHEQAMANIDSDKIVFRDISAVLRDMMPGSDENMFEAPNGKPSLYVISNDIMVNGAGEILCQQKMDEIAEQLGGDFIIIPSSTHECLIMPKDDSFDRTAIENMIMEVNSTMVPLSDRLSDHSYVYDASEHELVRADRMEARENDRKMDDRDRNAESGEIMKDDRSDSKSEKAVVKETDPKRTTMKERLAEKKLEASSLNANLPKPEKKLETALT